MIKYILLDIDGVLNKESDWHKPFTINNACVKEFAKAFEKYSPKIILTSSWRKGFISKNNKNNAPYIKELENELNKYSLCIGGVLNTDISRGKAVFDFIANHPDTICIDDDITEFKGYENKIPNLILVNAKTGFKRTDVKCI